MKSKDRTELERCYYSLPANIISDVQDEICKKTGWSLATFSNRIRGVVPMKPADDYLLKAIFEQYEIDYKL